MNYLDKRMRGFSSCQTKIIILLSIANRKEGRVPQVLIPLISKKQLEPLQTLVKLSWIWDWE